MSRTPVNLHSVGAVAMEVDVQESVDSEMAPQEWVVAALHDVAKMEKQTIAPQSHATELFDYYSIPAYNDGGQPVPESGGAIHSQKLVVDSGMVLFGKLNPRVPKVWLVGGDFGRRKIASTEFIPLSPIEGKITSDFLYYVCWSDWVMARSREIVSGSTPSRQRVDPRAFSQLLIPLPPLPEQRAIAHVLRTVQQAKEATEAVIAATRQLKKSLMRHLFTYGQVPVVGADQVPIQETEVGSVPANWSLGTLEDIKAAAKGAIVSGPFGSNIGKRFFVDNGVPVIRGNNLTKGRARFVDDGFVFVTEQKALELVSCTALPDDLVFTAAGTIGQVGIIPHDSRYSKYIISNKQLRARVDPTKAHPLYLFYWFCQDRMQRLVLQRQRGTSIPVINLGILRSLPIALPPLAEQREIAEILSIVDRKIEVEERRLNAIVQLFQSLLDHLMTGKVRVAGADTAVVAAGGA